MESKCPKCGEKLEDLKHKSAPFCSERCRLLDLGRWASETYKIPSHEAEGLEQALEEKIKEIEKFSNN